MKLTGPDRNLPQIGGEVQSALGYIRRQKWTNPVALDADRILNDAADNQTHTTFLAQPDFARKLTAVLSGAGTEVLTFNGTNIRGEAITEDLTLNGNTPVETLKAYKTVTSIVFPNTVGSRTLDVGVSDALGLDRCMSEGAVIDTFADGVKEATAATVTYHATDVSKNTIDLNTALDASVDVTALFVATEKTYNKATTA